MTVFKAYWKILNKNKFVVIMYTVILLVFGISNMQTSDNNMTFTNTKPDVLIINNDHDTKLTNNLIEYIEDNSNIKEVKIDEDSINDSLFYREVNYVIYIPENFSSDFLNGSNPEIEIKSTGDYNASLEEMILKRYLKVASTYLKVTNDEDELIKKINDTLKENVEVQTTSKLDTDSLSKATYYYNFSTYSTLACLILIIGLILSSFNEEKIKKRIVISSTTYKKHNRILLLANMCYALVIWLLYVIISFIIIGDVMFTTYGLLYIINLFILTICATILSFLIGTIVNNKDAMNGIVNVIALGSSFLCGVFVPTEFLPDAVLKIAHILPTYYYVNSNNLIETLEKINITTLKPLIINSGVILLFSIIFMVLSNIISRCKRKIN